MKNLKIFLIPLFLFTLYLFTISPASAATRTWNGSVDGNWSTDANWDENAAPQNGDDLVFPSRSLPVETSVNDIADLDLLSISVSSNHELTAGSGISLTTNTLNLDAATGATVAFSINNKTNNVTITKTGVGDGTISSVFGSGVTDPLILNYVINGGTLSDSMSFDSDPAQTSMTKTGTTESTLSVETVRDYTGGTTITAGEVISNVSGSFGTGTVALGGVANSLDTVLTLNSDVINNLVVKPVSSGKTVTIKAGTSTNKLLAGNITNDNSGPSTLVIDTPDSDPTLGLTFYGDITENSGTNLLSIIKNGAGLVKFRDATNTYTGVTTVNAGSVIFENTTATQTTVTSTSTGAAIFSKASTVGPMSSKVVTIGDFSASTGYFNNVTGTFGVSDVYNIKFVDSTNDKYSQLTVSGNITLGGSSVLTDNSANNLSFGTAPTLGQEFVILKSTGGSVSGTFSNQAQGSTINVGPHTFKVKYTTSEVKLVFAPAASPIFRFVNKLTGLHHFTIDINEANFLQTSPYGIANWTDEGTAFSGYVDEKTGTVAVFRFFNFKNGQHFLTTDTNEADFLRTSQYGLDNWEDEGISFYITTSQNSLNAPVHRFASKTNGEHFYTIDANETTFLQTSQYGIDNWIDEDVSFYGNL